METMTKPTLTPGEWLRKARADAGFSQTRAAKAIGVSRPLVTAWELGTRTPDIWEFRAMIRVYDAPWLASLLLDTEVADQYPSGYLGVPGFRLTLAA